MISVNFTKYHGQGNDYLYIMQNELRADINLNDLAIKMSDRHFGVGSDGIVILSNCESADIMMRIYNADGSEAEMCGTALRSTAFYISTLLNKKTLSVMTKSGLKYAIIHPDSVEVDMGQAISLADYPVEIKTASNTFKGFYISMGNPHFVINQSLEDKNNLPIWGNQIENDPYFVNKTNVEFVKIINKNEICVDIWERGSGITLACGTGACASVFALFNAGLLNNDVKVNLPGGIVRVNLDNNMHLRLIGPVEKVMTGLYYYGGL